MDTEAAMQLAIETAERGITTGQSPFGAVVLDPAGRLVTAEHNEVRKRCDPSAHAEIMALRAACKKLGRRDLRGFQIVSTCEPCPMCAAAIVFAGVRSLVFGASVVDAQRCGFELLQVPCAQLFAAGEIEMQIRAGVLSEECVSQLFRRG